MRARLLVSVVVVAALVLVVAGLAQARGAAETKVTIKGPNGDFHGKVKSEKGKCLGGREVTVYRLIGNGYDPENDEEIASDTSERQGDVGVWSVGNTGERNGAFYALVAKSQGCKAAFSKPLSL